MKFIKAFFAINFLVLTIIAIMQYIETSQTSNITASIFTGFIFILLIRSLFKKKDKISKQTVKNDTSIENLPQIITLSKSSIQYIQSQNVIHHTDNSPIKESEIPELIEIGYQEALQKERKSSNIKFKRTEKEEELSFQFMMNHGAELENKIEKFENCYQQALTATFLDEKIALYEQTIRLFKKAQNYAYKSKGGTIYFQDLYEHMHNSHNSDFSYLDLLHDELNCLMEKRDHIIPALKELLSSHKGILQKDLYQYIPDLSKSEVQKIIRELENQNEIKRTKKSGSYFLELVQ